MRIPMFPFVFFRRMTDAKLDDSESYPRHPVTVQCSSTEFDLEKGR